MQDLEKVTPAALRQIIHTRRPQGLFYAKEGFRLYFAVDNTTGDAWTEDFKSLRRCKRWLRNPHLTAGGDEA
jgi:hypothetical protein